MRRIGLLGGSFNPAHEGHLHISEQALAILELDEIWWLMSPGNPLKPPEGMAPFDKRMASAMKVVASSGVPVMVSDIEKNLGYRYSVDTVKVLQQRFYGYRFVWIMGADNLIQVHRWKHWQKFFKMVPIAVFPRPSYCLKARKSNAALHFAASRVVASRAAELAEMSPPAWGFLRARMHSASATRLRENKL